MSTIKAKFSKKKVGGRKVTNLTNATGSYYFESPAPKSKKKKLLILNVKGYPTVKLNGRAISSMQRVINAGK